MTQKPSAQGFLLPREHGAYAELAFPLASGLVLGASSPWAWTMAVGSVCVFLTYEPLAILTGTRGLRLKDQLSGAARRRLGWLMGFGAFAWVVSVVGLGSEALPTLLAPGVPFLALTPLFILGRHKSVVGEFLVVAIFAGLVIPIGAAGGAGYANTLPVASVWWVIFALGTLEVHAIKARAKTRNRKNGWTLWASPLAATAVVGYALAAWTWGAPYPSYALAALPPAFGVLAFELLRVHPRHLKRVGWTLVAANTLTFILLLAFG